MTVMTDQEYQDAVLALTSQEREEFSPFAFLNEAGEGICLGPVFGARSTHFARAKKVLRDRLD